MALWRLRCCICCAGFLVCSQHVEGAHCFRCSFLLGEKGQGQPEGSSKGSCLAGAFCICCSGLLVCGQHTRGTPQLLPLLAVEVGQGQCAATALFTIIRSKLQACLVCI